MMAKKTTRAGGLPFRFKNAKTGKPFGSFYIRIGKTELCLKTRDPDEANARARRARVEGERNFSSDSDAANAASAVSAAITGTGGAKTSPVVEPPAAPAPILSPPAPPAPPTPPAALPSVHTPPAALPPIPPTSTPPRLTVVPDVVIPPPPGWADGLRAAAAEAEASSSSSAEAGDDDAEDVLTPDMLEDIIDQAAETAVALQIGAQSWLLAHAKPVIGVNIDGAPVPETAKGRAVGKKIWKKAFRRLVSRYMPSMDLPDWLVAPVLVASLTIPVQLGEGAKVKPDDPDTETAPSAPGASAAAA